jgi:hypothetical protein
MKSFKVFDWVFLLGLFLVFLLPPTDPDLGWQIRCGQEIWQRQGFCSQNHFSVLDVGYSWPNHHWLYQAIIFPVFSIFGLWGLTFLNSAIVTLSFLFFYLAIKNYFWEKMAAIVLIILLGWGVFSYGIRSQILSLVFLNLLFCLFLKIERNPKMAFFLPLVILVWANSHGSVILGLVLLLLFLIKEVTRKAKKSLFLSLIFLICLFSALINPFGIRIFEEAWRHFGVVKLDQLIAEWTPPTPAIWWLILVGSLVLFFYLIASQKIEEMILALLIIPFTILALKARRNVPYYFLISFYLFLKSSLTKRLFISWLKKNNLRDSLAVGTGISLLVVGFFIRMLLTINTNLSWQNFCQSGSVDFPYKAVEFMRQQPPANIFNRYEWGGFLIWQLPSFKIFVDGRMPAWPTPEGKSPYTIYLETLQTQPGWQETLKEYNIGWILISPGTFMDLLLRPDPKKFGWKEVYRDKTAVIYQR